MIEEAGAQSSSPHRFLFLSYSVADGGAKEMILLHGVK